MTKIIHWFFRTILAAINEADYEIYIRQYSDAESFVSLLNPRR